MDTPIYRFQDMIDYFDRKGITYNLTEDGYSIIDAFITTAKNPIKTKKQILGYAKYSKYSSSLFDKYEAHTPVWVAFETMSFGTLVNFIEFYLQRNPSSEFQYLSKNLYAIKNIRNTAAHSSSLLNEIVGEQEEFANNKLVTTFVYKRIPNKNFAKKKLNNLRIHDMTVLYIVYNQLMPEGRTKKERTRELYKFLARARKKKELYLKHNQLHLIYTFFCKIILSK